MTGRCATCKWAEEVYPSTDRLGRQWVLSCERDTFGHYDTAKMSADMACAVYVAPDFGCVQWEAREGE